MRKTQITAEPGIPTIITAREFAAPRSLLFRAHTEPDLLERWLGPRDLTLKVECYDARDGGKWRYVNADAQGNAFGFQGVFHGDPTPDAIVQTLEFDGAPGHVCLQSVTFAERGGATQATTVLAFLSVEDRDAMVASGMDRGVQDSGNRLTELLDELAEG
jgi:uncharacterized protein YndB with AHSA1/START domain